MDNYSKQKSFAGSLATSEQCFRCEGEDAPMPSWNDLRFLANRLNLLENSHYS